MKTVNILIISVAIVITALIFSIPLRSFFKKNETITVTGLATKDFVSDLIVWNGSFSRKATVLTDAYTLLKKDLETVRKYLISKGIEEKEIVFSSISLVKDFKYITKNGNSEQEFDGFNLSQTVTIESTDVEKVEKVSREVTELINQGVELNSSNPQYYYTKLSELKQEMLAAATRDGRARAEKIADNAGCKLNGLRYASQGIFQITAQNSDENFSWGGAFNIESKGKTATVTVKLQFAIGSKWF